ncbi:MAG: ribosomal RNA small subunit methyltransferase B [Porticoccaceae bacterium]|nr:MAG: ribosomal RNA small subunit methyltransferase B [Porticoccaceae bacterium]
MDARAAAARLVAAVRTGRGSLATLPFPATGEASLLRELCYGTLRHHEALAALLARLLHRPRKRLDPEVEALLLVGLYQLRELALPAHAAVHRTVDATAALGKPWARGLVNALLRRYQRERAALEEAIAALPAARTLHPDWLRERIAAAWGERAEAIFAANNARPPMTLRVNRRRTSREAYLERLAAADIAARPAPLAPEGIYLAEPREVAALPGFAEGWASVQDEGAQLAAHLLAPAGGERILDACAAPGGKSCHLLEIAAPRELVALDLDGERLRRLAENLARLGLSATLLAADAADLASWWDGTPFDRVLLDVPCTGTGVIRRHPDIRLLRRPEDVPPLAAAQARLLENLWRVLRPGGTLLYATCSVLPEENDAVVAAFAARHADCRVVPIAAPWGLPTAQGRQLLPAADGSDGFYYALLEKTAAA